MNDYYFIYKNKYGTFDTCTNPEFIAKHKACRAIPKAVLYNNKVTIQAVKNYLNKFDIDTRNEMLENILNDWGYNEI